MLSNYLKLALRNLQRRGFFSMINISGLAVGLASCWLIALFVFHEQSFDRFLPNADRICAVALDLKMGDQEGRTTNTPPPLGLRLAADFPEIDMTARTFPLGSVVVRREQPGHEPLVFNEEAAMAVDTAFLELFGFPMAEGGDAALDRPGSTPPGGSWRQVANGGDLVGARLQSAPALQTPQGACKPRRP